jgi:hypothetical protein
MKEISRKKLTVTAWGGGCETFYCQKVLEILRKELAITGNVAIGPRQKGGGFLR